MTIREDPLYEDEIRSFARGYGDAGGVSAAPDRTSYMRKGLHKGLYEEERPSPR